MDECNARASPIALSGLAGHYRMLITKFRDSNVSAPVSRQHYDYGWPTGTGVFGPADWLDEPTVKARVPSKLRRDLFRRSDQRVRKAQMDLAKDTQNFGPISVFVPETAGTLLVAASYSAIISLDSEATARSRSRIRFVGYLLATPSLRRNHDPNPSRSNRHRPT